MHTTRTLSRQGWSARRAGLAILETLEARQLLSVSFSGGTLSILGTNLADTIGIRDDGRVAGKIVVQMNGKTVGTFDRRVRTIRVNGGKGDDTVLANLTAGRSVSRSLAIANSGGTDSLKIVGNLATLANTTAGVNRWRSVFSQATAKWEAMDGVDPVMWKVNRKVGSTVTSTASVARTGTETIAPSYATVGGVQAPYSGAPIVAGAVMQAEDFDKGGEGTAYHDTTGKNFGGAYRPKEGVDIQTVSDVGGGYYVGWTRAREWLEYTIDVPAAGLYDLAERVAASGTGGAFHIEIDGADLTGLIAVPNTGGWQKWATAEQRGIALQAGQHVLRLFMNTAGSSGYVMNLNWLQLSAATPAAPTNLAASPTSGTDVALSWRDNADNEIGYVIERMAVAGDWQAVAALGADSTSYNDSGLDPAVGYTYRVRATNARGDSENSDVAVVVAMPSAPTGLMAIPTSSSQITVSWSDADNESGYVLERRMDAGNWQQIATLGPDVTSYTDDTLYADTEYAYRVTATNVRGSSTCSSGTSAMIPAVLVPGTGWTGPTEQPAAVGDPAAAGYDAKAIARWDVVPYQTFDGDFGVGIPAFHMSGIDRVEFSVDNGPWLAVRKMTLNPWSNVVEYWTMLKASSFAQSRAAEVRAIAYPTDGEPRVLEGLSLNVDRDGSVLANRQIRYVSPTGSNTTGDGSQENPYATIKQAAMSICQTQGGNADNGIIYLMPGDYPLSGGWTGATWINPSTKSAYLTIAGAPTTTPDQVRITTGGSTQRLQVDYLRLSGLTVDAGLSNGPRPGVSHLWLDGAYWGWNAGQGDFGRTYYTDVRTYNAFQGIFGGFLVRNFHAENLYSDAFQNTQTVINASITGLDQREYADVHPDLIQWNWTAGNLDNCIYYNIKATDLKAQQLFIAGPKDPVAGGVSFSNIAVVNVLAVNVIGDYGFSQVALPGDHLLVWNSSFLRGGGMSLTDKGGLISNVSIRNSVFQLLEDASAWTGTIANNHFISGTVRGTQATGGDPLLDLSFRPALHSPLRNRAVDLLVPTDAENRAIYLITGSIGALQPLE